MQMVRREYHRHRRGSANERRMVGRVKKAYRLSDSDLWQRTTTVRPIGARDFDEGSRLCAFARAPQRHRDASRHRRGHLHLFAHDVVDGVLLDDGVGGRG